MSEYTTDQVLRMLEAWYDAQPDPKPDPPFKGFEGLLGADLRELDLSNATIQQEAQAYREQNGGGDPPWLGIPFSPGEEGIRGLELSGALLSQNEEGKRANLSGAQLQGAILMKAQLQGANLWGAKFEQADLEEVDWSGKNGHVLDEQPLDGAETVYRHLKQWYSNSGQYEHAGEFHKPEMTMRRKGLWGNRSWSQWFYLLLMEGFCGYGERPARVLYLTLLSWVGFALLYWLGGALGGQTLPGVPLAALWAALYVSGTATITFEPHLLPGYTPVSVAPWAGTVALLQGPSPTSCWRCSWSPLCRKRPASRGASFQPSAISFQPTPPVLGGG